MNFSPSQYFYCYCGKFSKYQVGNSAIDSSSQSHSGVNGSFELAPLRTSIVRSPAPAAPMMSTLRLSPSIIVSSRRKPVRRNAASKNSAFGLPTSVTGKCGAENAQNHGGVKRAATTERRALPKGGRARDGSTDLRGDIHTEVAAAARGRP